MAVVEKAKDVMQSSAEQHIFITGACGAGKSTLGRALSSQLQLPLHRLDDDLDFRQMLPYEPYLHRVTDPQRYARWQALRRHLVQEAVNLPEPHIIEGTHILVAPELTTGHRRILVDTPLLRLSGKIWRGIAPSTPRTPPGTPSVMRARLALLQHGSARYAHGRSTKVYDWRLTPSGNSLG